LGDNAAKKIFIIGPPGFKVREFALQVADHYKLTTVSVGDLLKKEVSKKQELGE
jgi:adenylate kinase family enzyme